MNKKRRNGGRKGQTIAITNTHCVRTREIHTGWYTIKGIICVLELSEMKPWRPLFYPKSQAQEQP